MNLQTKLSHFLDQKQGFSELTFTEQVKYLAFFYIAVCEEVSFSIKDISNAYDMSDIPKPKNVGQYIRLLVVSNVLIPKNGGYTINRDVKKIMEEEFSQNKPTVKFTHSLRETSKKLTNVDEKSFMDEAIDCFEIGSFRAAVIMSWLVTMNHLYSYVFANKLNEFNVALAKQNLKITVINTLDDFNEIDESRFITVCRSANIITNDQRKILEEKLGTRNTAAHPNRVKISESKCISFVEDLVDNIIVRF